MSIQNYILNFKYDVTLVHSGKCWVNRLTVPLINDESMQQRNILTLLTRALFDNEHDLKVEGHVVNHSPDLIVKDGYGFEPDPLWIYTRDVTQATINKAKHKSQRQLQVTAQHTAEVEKVSFEPGFIDKLLLLDFNLHLSIIVDGDDISVTDGLTFVQGSVKNLELLINIFEGQEMQYA